MVFLISVTDCKSNEFPTDDELQSLMSSYQLG
jgi:hypothetical protein